MAVPVEQLRSLPRIHRVNAAFVFALPALWVSGGKRSCVIDAHRNLDLAARTGVEPQPGIRFTPFGQNGHHRPVAASEDSLKRLFVHAARFGRIAGMRVNPQPKESFRPQTRVDLFVEIIGDRFVIEFDGDDNGVLTDQPHVFHQ